MSATYNWAYRPGVTNKYGFTVPAGADNARPTGWCYVALFGNDSTGNGSRQYPYRTITKACTLSSVTIVLASGVYRELATLSTINSLVGDGDVVIDISYITYLFNTNSTSAKFYNFRLKGDGISSFLTSSYFNTCVFTDIYLDGSYLSPTIAGVNSNALTGCITTNFSAPIGIGGGQTTLKSCTYVNCNNIVFMNSATSLIDSSIFSFCNLSFQNSTVVKLQYTLLFSCNFKLNGTSSGGVLYPSTPSGYTYYSTIDSLQSAWTGLYGGASFPFCTINDPLFNNIVIGDYTLSFASPAKSLSFFGTYVGAKSIAYQVKASATESTGSFDFSTNVNLTVANDSITLVDPTQNAEIKTKLIINEVGRQINKLPIYGFNADRNGQYIDSIPDLAATVKNAGDTLTVLASYLVETGAITYNSAIYQVGDRITTVAGQTAFTTSASGVLREILEAPERHTIMARFSDGGASISAGAPLTVGYWYYVVTGNITYDSVVYSAGHGFKAVDTNAFSGSGTVIVALSTETFQHYEPGIQPTSNNTGDTRIGSIIRGNGDPAYVRGGYGVQEFPIIAKFIQLYYIINISNLKP